MNEIIGKIVVWSLVIGGGAVVLFFAIIGAMVISSMWRR